MAKTSWASASQRMSGPGVEGAGDDVGGGWTAGFSRIHVDMDMSDMYGGFPGDACPLEHFGYVIAGRFAVTWPDGTEEVFEAGDAFHIMPGHKPRYEAGLEVLDFSPTEASAEVLAAMQARMPEMMARLQAQSAQQE